MKLISHCGDAEARRKKIRAIMREQEEGNPHGTGDYRKSAAFISDERELVVIPVLLL